MTSRSTDVDERNAALGLTYMLAMLGGFGGFALAMVNSFKRVVSPALVLALRRAARGSSSEPSPR